MLFDYCSDILERFLLVSIRLISHRLDAVDAAILTPYRLPSYSVYGYISDGHGSGSIAVFLSCQPVTTRPQSDERLLQHVVDIAFRIQEAPGKSPKPATSAGKCIYQIVLAYFILLSNSITCNRMFCNTPSQKK